MGEDNVPHRFRCCNTWAPVGGGVWVVLGDMDLQEEVCHWGWALRLKMLTPFPPLSPLPTSSSRCKLSASSSNHSSCTLHMYSKPNAARNPSSSISCLAHVLS